MRIIKPDKTLVLRDFVEIRDGIIEYFKEQDFTYVDQNGVKKQWVFTPNSPNFHIISIFTLQLLKRDSYYIESLQGYSPIKAESTALNNLVALKGMTRIMGFKSTGKVTFRVEDGFIGSVLIPKGTVLKTTNDIKFISLQGTLISANTVKILDDDGKETGEEEDIGVDVLFECTEKGLVGNVGIGSITEWDSNPIDNIKDGFSNQAPFNGGKNIETDFQLRKRFYELKPLQPLSYLKNAIQNMGYIDSSGIKQLLVDRVHLHQNTTTETDSLGVPAFTILISILPLNEDLITSDLDSELMIRFKKALGEVLYNNSAIGMSTVIKKENTEDTDKKIETINFSYSPTVGVDEEANDSIKYGFVFFEQVVLFFNIDIYVTSPISQYVTGEVQNERQVLTGLLGNNIINEIRRNITVVLNANLDLDSYTSRLFEDNGIYSSVSNFVKNIDVLLNSALFKRNESLSYLNAGDKFGSEVKLKINQNIKIDTDDKIRDVDVLKTQYFKWKFHAVKNLKGSS